MKFTEDGKFVMQIGKIAPTKGSNDTTMLGKPAETTYDKDAGELYIADGYGNRRVIVFDATSGAYKRHWGAYGKPPNDDKQAAYDPKAPVSQQFGNPVHCVKVTDDGFVYVCDRINDRIQVFKKDGTFVKEWFYEKNTLGNGAVWDVAVWPDPKQTYLLSADGENNEIRIIRREDGTVVGSFGGNGRNAGQFHWVHAMAIDAKGNVYTAEVDTGKRIQKFKLTSDALK
jgi:DNA-binding beta-propeller fold protein YncE